MPHPRLLLSVLTLSCSLLLTGTAMSAEPKSSALDFQMNALDGQPVDLQQYAGKVVLMVNVASYCGATPQYKGLQSLYSQHKNDGLVVLGFPCNQFGAQEPGSAEEIQKFCETKYQVTFPMFAKIDVNGEKAAPLYQHLTAQNTQPKGAGKIGWNFEKFLIGKDGAVAARFGTGTQPDDPELVEAIRQELAK